MSIVATRVRLIAVELLEHVGGGADDTEATTLALDAVTENVPTESAFAESSLNVTDDPATVASSTSGSTDVDNFDPERQMFREAQDATARRAYLPSSTPYLRETMQISDAMRTQSAQKLPAVRALGAEIARDVLDNQAVYTSTPALRANAEANVFEPLRDRLTGVVPDASSMTSEQLYELASESRDPRVQPLGTFADFVSGAAGGRWTQNGTTMHMLGHLGGYVATAFAGPAAIPAMTALGARDIAASSVNLASDVPGAGIDLALDVASTALPFAGPIARTASGVFRGK